ncbi:hypothetical protein QA645_32560 [Bradyrhizobium sp. CIAT3101]|uniref:hypothetical protein n=1 Tax=Bradyrhizobium sp. CIAT3101 TaxID=439387 RepID=UPI0024B0412C|nr:hypothetical protein [Bradyrhizobium sp. CIAT3101]WFU79217.1 hypothetical protein QA645_32560 [Bradyrhizobium sp. CIAT3101]
MAGRLSGEIQRLIAKVLGQFSASIGVDATNARREIAIMLLSKDDILIESHSGLVVAGFGRKDYFPVMQMYELGEVYSGRLKHRTPKVERISLLAGIDLLTGKVHALVRDRHRSREFVEFLKLLDAAYPASTAIKLILDNHSAHILRETRACLDT